MEESVSVIYSVPEPYRSLFVTIIGEKDADLLASLRTNDEPSRNERLAVEDILSTEFSNNLLPDDEPTSRGRDIDNALGAFLLRWPIEN
jgi:hypothetical protein